jgi:hypothetical protein
MNKKITRKKRVVTQAAVTHMELIKSRLDELKPNITTSDRQAAVQALKVSKATISKYLNGVVLDPETGIMLLELFHARVTAREERLKILDLKTNVA